MLVISRMRDETVIIGDSITVTVVDIRGDKVRLGINADKSIPIDRFEVRMKADYKPRPGQSLDGALKG